MSLITLPWTFEPAVVTGLLVTGAAYAVGLHALWGHAGLGRGVSGPQAAAFAAGWLTLALALTSPLHELGESLFSAHMIQHELLMVVAAPLLILGRPVVPFLWAIPIAWRHAIRSSTHATAVQRFWRWIRHPGVIWLLHAVVIWGWHLPRLYDASVESSWVHAIQHTSFLMVALLFWWHVFERTRGGEARAWGLVFLVTTAAQTGVLGALLTFATHPLYAVYSATTVWGVTPLEDQQVAGLIMWIPGGIVYMAAALAVAASWLGEGIHPAVRVASAT
jgi:putative membrane protein